MKTLLNAPTRKPSNSRLAASLPSAAAAAAARGSAQRVTCEFKEPNNRPFPEAAPQSDFQHIRFDRFFPDAKEVGIAGSFNGWQPAATPMERFGMGCGQRKVDLYLKPGRYEYRFVVDGNWTDDPFARTFVPNPFGTRNAVLVVVEPNNARRCATDSQATIVADIFDHGSPLSSNGFEENLDSSESSGSTCVQRHRQIEELAYNLYLQRGKEPGHAFEDWLQAEKRLRTLIAAEEFGTN